VNEQAYLSRDFLIGEVLARNARKYPDQLAFKEGDRSFTYSQYNFRVNKLANALRELGIGRGNKVAILMFNLISGRFYPELFHFNIKMCPAHIQEFGSPAFISPGFLKGF